jgi:hypothetical protein
VWLQLLAEIRSLGARVVYASFTRITIATDKASLHDGRAHLDFLLASIARKPIFSFVRLTPMRFWSTLLFLDGANYGGITHRDETTQSADEAAAPDGGVEAAAEGMEAEGMEAEGMEAEGMDSMEEDGGAMDAEGGATAVNETAAGADEPTSAADPAAAEPERRRTDRDTAMTLCEWNLAHHLPPAIQSAFRKTIDLYVAEPWTRAAIEAEKDGRDAPALEEVEAHAKDFFDEFFSMRLLEQVPPHRRRTSRAAPCHTTPSPHAATRRHTPPHAATRRHTPAHAIHADAPALMPSPVLHIAASAHLSRAARAAARRCTRFVRRSPRQAGPSARLCVTAPPQPTWSRAPSLCSLDRTCNSPTLPSSLPRPCATSHRSSAPLRPTCSGCGATSCDRYSPPTIAHSNRWPNCPPLHCHRAAHHCNAHRRATRRSVPRRRVSRRATRHPPPTCMWWPVHACALVSAGRARVCYRGRLA